jgi:outer membrane autotransporter protein
MSQPARAITINDAQIGNPEYVNGTAQFPSVVATLKDTQYWCTGALIDSRTVLTAAHCFDPAVNKVSFQTNASNDPNAIAISSYFTHKNFVFPGGPDNDIAVISLSRPVTNIRPLLLAPTIPEPGSGTRLFLVGYSNGGKGSDCCNPPLPNGIRRMATSEFGAYEVVSTNQSFLRTQFRDPANPFGQNPLNPNLNFFNLPASVPTSTLEGGTVPGDSGSPVFMMSENGLVQIGVLHGGLNPLAPAGCSTAGFPMTNQCKAGQYGDISDYTALADFLGWVHENNPLRQVTASAGNFTWNNPAAWRDEFADAANPNGAVPNNTVGDVGNNPARYYDVNLSKPGTITLDMNPQIDTLSITGSQSQLVIGALYTLEVLLGTELSAGTLTMSGGTLISPEFLMSDGRLTGSGTIVAAGGAAGFSTGLCNSGMCVTGGTVAPVGMLSIQGNYTQTGGLLQFELAPTGANGLLAVSKTATLGGTLDVTVRAGLYGVSTPYTLLTASAIDGKFAQSISSPLSAFLSFSGPMYSPTSVGVTLTRTPFGAVAGLNANQRAVGNALESAYATTLTGPAATLYTNLLMTGTPQALSQLSGEGTTAAQNATFASGRMFDSLLMDQGAFWRSGETADSNGVTFREAPLAYAPEKKNKAASAAFKELKAPPVYQPRTWRVWSGGFGGVQSFNGDASIGSADARSAAAGGAMGFDYQVDPTRLVGVAVGGSDSHFSVPDRATSGNLVGGHVGAYGVASWGALYAAGVLSYSRFDNEVTRTIAGVGPPETATGRFASDLFGARLEVGRSYALPWLNVTPFAAVQTATLWQRGFTETSAADGLPGILGLSYQSHTTTSLPTFLGVQLDTRWALTNGMVWSPFVRAAWMHEFRPDRSIAGSFVSVPGALFAVDGARAWSDALKINAGSRLALNQYASLFASFDGEFANSGHSYAGRGGVRFSW